MLGLYIHIPFCNKLCYFCDFPKLIKQNENIKDAYLNKLISDIDKLKDNNETFDTLYIGGGTPNSLSIKQLELLLSKINQLKFINNAERTIECNFELINQEQINLFKKYNINRISIGVQTFNKKVGKLINRISDYKVLKEKVNLLRNNDINNINIDMMYGLPSQSFRTLKSDLKRVLRLNPYHLSYYQLIMEDKAVLSFKNNRYANEDTILKMTNYINNKLKKYHHYEISNYAINGYESKHNMLYWNTADSYIGLGLSSASYYKGKRYQNSKSMKKYLSDLDINNDEVINGEYFILGLRMLDGVSINKYKELYKEDPFEVYNIKHLIDNDLLEYNNDILKLTKKGLDLANIVFEQFI